MTRGGVRFENIRKAVEAIKTFGEEGMSVKDVAELVNVSTTTIYNMQADLNQNDIVWRNEKNGRRFYYKPNMKEAYKNSEGYTDKTVGDVLTGKKVVDDFKVGGIYENKYLVLKVFSDTLVYISVEPYQTKSGFCSDTCVRFDLDGQEVFVNPHRIWSVSVNKVNKSDRKTIDMGLYRQIVGLAGMSVVEVEVPVVKEIVQEVVKEVPVKDVEFKLMEQKAEIYEKCFYAVTGKGA